MCRSPPSPPFTNTNNKPSLVKNLTTNNNNNNKNMETPLLHTTPQPAKANKRKRLNAVLDKLAGNMGMENMESMASTMDKMVTSNNEETRPATHLEISLSMAEERSTSEESEEERPHSSSSAVSSPKNEDASFSPSSNPFLSSLINPTTTTTTPPGLDYLKSQLLSKMYLQQYMTNNLTSPVLPLTTRIQEAPEGRRNPKESKKEGKKLEVRRESKEGRRDHLRDTTECVGPLDLSRTSGPPSGKQPSPPPPPANEDVAQKQGAPQQFPFPPFPSLLLPSSSSPSSNSKEEEAASPPPPSPPSKTTTNSNSKGVVEASASPPGSTYGCPVCGQKFSLHDRLAKHMASRHKAHKVDSQSKAYFCEVCRRSFARSDMLTRHVRLHTGLKPYTCRVCNQVFSRSDHLSTHQRTHTGEKPYKCPSCPYSACRRDMITRHMRTHSRYSMGDAAALVEAAQREAALKLEPMEV